MKIELLERSAEIWIWFLFILFKIVFYLLLIIVTFIQRLYYLLSRWKIDVVWKILERKMIGLFTIYYLIVIGAKNMRPLLLILLFIFYSIISSYKLSTCPMKMTLPINIANIRFFQRNSFLIKIIEICVRARSVLIVCRHHFLTFSSSRLIQSSLK